MHSSSTLARFAQASSLIALLATAACADQRLGAPGQAPPLETMRTSGDAATVAQCTFAAMQAADECDSIDYGLGITTNEVTKAVNLTCYNVTPAAVSAGAAFGLIGILVGAAVGEKEPVGENNKRPPLYTAVFEDVATNDVKVSFWVRTTADGPEYYTAKIKTAIDKCQGQTAQSAPVPTPAVPATPAPAVPVDTAVKPAS